MNFCQSFFDVLVLQILRIRLLGVDTGNGTVKGGGVIEKVEGQFRYFR